MKTPLRPYANEADTLAVGELTIENRSDRLSLYGSLDLTRDRAGLERARVLKALLDATVKQLEIDEAAGKLPDAVAIEPADSIKNPFA